MLRQRVYHGATLRDFGPCGNPVAGDHVNGYLNAYGACILTVVTTLQMQQRGTYAFLDQGQEASVRGSKPPSLYPTT